MEKLSLSPEKLDEVALVPTVVTHLDDSNAHERSGQIFLPVTDKTVVDDQEFKCSEHESRESQDQVNSTQNDENKIVSSSNLLENVPERGCCVTPRKQLLSKEESDAEMVRRAKEEGIVSVVFPGIVTQEGCCRFVSEILKCVLYQRQQLPMTYDQLVYTQKNWQDSKADKDVISGRKVNLADMNGRKCQKTLQDLEEVLHRLEVLFSLSKVPRVLLLMGGSLVLPKEIYEINLEELVLGSGDKCLRVSSCLRQLFRTLFIADLLSDSKPGRLMPTTVLALAHRDCGVGWFHPKLRFKVPTSIKKKKIALCSNVQECGNESTDVMDWQEYVWFQAPTAIKGFF
ncbi:MAD2L1-binding protein [Corythoichthys intestinalis]|uniref:MAD2L1-binding protein n=1 Tax=Corythoichthys intestinalis TaxID=161448 RepID=UPI0025A546E1|nr:MAD2L1-binding protein [Corythoichthys intestinalis]XP_061794486.1 MAD2L1-binding protein-like [Nerophis lumbriciformis]